MWFMKTKKALSRLEQGKRSNRRLSKWLVGGVVGIILLLPSLLAPLMEKQHMSINKKNLRELVVRPTLKEHNLWSPEAEELLMLTFAQETHLGTYLKQGLQALSDGRGVGRGIGSMEPGTFKWLKELYPHILGNRDVDELIWDLKLAVISTRLRYRAVAAKIPEANDVQGLALYWNTHYNCTTVPGLIQEAMFNYDALVKH